MRAASIKTINLKSDMPSVREAMERLEQAIAVARQEKQLALKVIHGYGSTGVGGDIRAAVQRRLREMAQDGKIQNCIFGEEWTKSSEETWRLVQERPELKSDIDLGRGNAGITIVLL